MEGHPVLAYTVSEAAEMLRVSPAHLYRMIRQGEVNAVHLGRAVRVPQAELERLCGVEPAADLSSNRHMVH